MKFNRRVRDRMSLILFLLGNIASVALSDLDNETGLNLVCTNDFEDLMSCHFDAQNCTEYNLTLRSNDGYGEQRCIVKQCDTGRCCCSVKMKPGETHTATVFKGGQSVESKVISITASVKPKAPTIISVNESNGNFRVEWTANTNSNSLRSRLSAQVTYHKKGDTKEVSENITTAIVNGPNYYEILGKHLEPSTTYLVSVKSYTNISGLFSDSSEEHEFKTPASRHALLLAVIICLSFAAVIITSVALGCFEISGMSTGFSSAIIEPADIKAGVRDALSKAFVHIGPRSSVTASLLTESNKDSDLLSATYNPCVTADDLKNSPQSTDFDNMTYLIRIPSCQIMMNNSEMFCDSVYHPSEGDMMTCPDKQAPVCPDPVQQNIILPAVVSSLMPTDMSYQCSPDKQVPVQDGQCLSDDQRPFLSFISANPSTPIITDSDYHSV
ncbi:uncharacterized protein LOC122974723 isoform X3 [Thunnus albacares]|uniref:uncharacterized protein LOC122974723 isoform X3 n=1 Tax=Thunnus albacares TaxID=8236 RepID=UPI001CF6FE55|nr:uncharacterized protein LOC122974723 isoform X3 [Thunnus albacares]